MAGELGREKVRAIRLRENALVLNILLLLPFLEQLFNPVQPGLQARHIVLNNGLHHRYDGVHLVVVDVVSAAAEEHGGRDVQFPGNPADEAGGGKLRARFHDGQVLL